MSQQIKGGKANVPEMKITFRETINSQFPAILTWESAPMVLTMVSEDQEKRHDLYRTRTPEHMQIN